MWKELRITLLKSFSSFHLFPNTLFLSLLTTILGIWIIDGEKQFEILKVALACFISIPIFYGFEVSRNKLKGPYWLNKGIAFVFLLLIYFFLIPDFKENNQTTSIRVLVVFVCAHLWVSIAPFLFSKSVDLFWHYNKQLFLSIFTAFLYTMTLFFGLLIALLAIKNLFNVNIEWYAFKNLFLICNLFFNTLIFIGKSPDLEKLSIDYPKGLKYFVLYVLMPLLCIYLCILLAYQFKIILSWSLPKGYVSVMVLVSGIFGILAFLFLYPLKSNSQWIQRFNKWYYWVLVWLVLLLLVSIYVRIDQYGLTDARYYVALLGLWLLGISLYFIISKADDIKAIPFSLFLILLLSVFGPQSASFLSISHQTMRLKKVLQKDLKKFDNKDIDMANASIEYISENDPSFFKKVLNAKDYKNVKNTKSWELGIKVKEALKIPSKPTQEYNQKIFFGTNENVVNLEESNYLVNFSVNNTDNKQSIKLPDNQKLTILSDPKKILFKINEDVYEFDFNAILNLPSGQKTPLDMTFKKQNKQWVYKLIVSDANFSGTTIYNVSGKLLLKKQK